MPEWRHTEGDLERVGGFIVFERSEPFGRAYVVADEQRRPTIVSWDVDSPDEKVTDLKKAIREWLDDEGQQIFAHICGIDPEAVVRDKRGRKEEWPDEKLMGLVDLVLDRQENAEARPTDLRDVAPFYLSNGRTRQLMAAAEERKLVAVERRDGKPNRYRRVDTIPAELATESPAPADVLRATRFWLNRKRRELEPDPARKRQLPP